MKIISIINTKGGVGKTVTTIHLGAALARKGCNVLLVDVDLQHGLTSYFGIEPRDGETMAEVLADGFPITDAAQRVRDNLWIVPATAVIERIEGELATAPGAEFRLKRAFKQAVSDQGTTEAPVWDVVLIDCPSGWGAVSRNAIAASDAMIVPVNSEPAAAHCAMGTVAATRELGEYHDHDVALLGVLLTRFRHTKAAQAVAGMVENQWGNALFDTRIRQAEKINELAIAGVTTGDVSVAMGGAVAADYEALAGEVLRRGKIQNA